MTNKRIAPRIGIARGKCAEKLVAKHQLDGDAGHINPHARRERFAEKKKAACRLAGAVAEGIGEKLVGRINLALEIMRHHDHGQDDARDDIADDQLEKRQVAVDGVGHGGHADDGQRAGFRGDDGQADAPPRDVLAAEEIVARVVLVAPEPGSQGDNAAEVKDNNAPIGGIQKTSGCVLHQARRMA